MLSDLRPVGRAVLFDILNQGSVFFLRPRAFDHLRVQYLLPSVQALDIGPIVESFSYLFPVSRLHKQVIRFSGLFLEAYLLPSAARDLSVFGPRKKGKTWLKSCRESADMARKLFFMINLTYL